MSRSLYWRPAPKETPPDNDLPDGLMAVLRQRAERTFGSLDHETEYGLSDIPYLEGVADAGSPDVSDGANELIAAIREHGQVLVWTGS